MRIILAGSQAARARLRSRINGTPVDIVAEFATVGAARRSGLDADGILIAGQADADDQDAYHEALTARELDVLEGLAEGLSNRAIAERLRISDQTVKFHVASVMAKLGAANRTDAVRRAVREGIVTL
ncbi:MAG TPA: response regulator transcription factor [Vicinamibacterales bacterium]